jgi:hypothetical protein
VTNSGTQAQAVSGYTTHGVRDQGMVDRHHSLIRHLVLDKCEGPVELPANRANSDTRGAGVMNIVIVAAGEVDE